MNTIPIKRIAWALAITASCTGCGRAPSFEIIGSFLPVWMLCLAVAIVITFVARSLLVRYHLETEVGPPALFYPCVVVLSSCLLWLIFFQ